MSNKQNDIINENKVEVYADLNDELVVKSKLIIERYNLGQYTNAGDAILDGVKLGLEMSRKINKEIDEKYHLDPTPEEDNMYQGRSL